jgi:anti-sigma-K factor RskA
MTGEHDPLAAEHALGLLDQDERIQASARVSSDAEFAGAVARWRGKLAPLFAEIAPIAPPAALWAKIDAATAPAGGEVVMLRRRLSVWRGGAIGMTALAASLAALLLTAPPAILPTARQPAASTPMVAMLGDSRDQMKLVASWDPDARRLIVAVAGDMPADPGHAHEVWIIPAGGKPRSLGTMGSERVHMRLADALAELMRQGATIAVSAEPMGGSPTGTPTGPFLASGSLIPA